MTPGGTGWQDEATAKAASSTSQGLRADHTHSGHQRRLARAVAERVTDVIQHNEEVLAFTEAVEQCRPLARAVLGACWAPAHRVALVFTGQRLIEITLDCSGRRAGGRVRSFPWDRVPGIQVADHWLELRTWAEATFRWYLRDELQPATADRLRTQVDLAVSTYQPSEPRSVPLDHCGQCGAVRPGPRDPCRRCGLLPRSARLAGRLALALPGGGHLYARRPLAATWHLVLEVALLGATAASVLTARMPRDGWLAFAVGAIALGLAKLQAVPSARQLAALAEPVHRVIDRRWRLLAGVGMLLEIAVLALPMWFVGAADPTISADLHFLPSGDGWVGRRAHPVGYPLADRPGERSRWSHGDGLVVEVDARPLHRFEPVERARTRLEDELGPHAEQVTVGPFRAIRSQDPAPTGMVGLHLAVIDEVGRDVHTLSARVPAADVERDRRLMEGLLRRGVWVSTAFPHLTP